MVRWVYGLVGAALAAGGLALLLFNELNTIPVPYLVLLVGGTVGVSFAVGYVLGYVAESGLWPSSRTRE